MNWFNDLFINEAKAALDNRKNQGGEPPVITSLSVTENGVYEVPEGTDGYSPVTVNVESSGGSEDYLAMKLNGTLTEYSSSEVTSVANHTFYYDRVIKKVSLPAVTSVGSNAFYSCGNLLEFSAPAVTSIADYAFYLCSQLESLNISAVKSIAGSNAFTNCSKLTSVDFPALTSISGRSAFSSCSRLETVNAPNLTSIGEQVFSDCTKLKTLDFSKITSIGQGAFRNCTSLSANLNLPLATSVGSNCFGNCSSLTSVNLPSLTSLTSQSLFANCSNLTSVNIPCMSTTAKLPDSMFSGCTKLTGLDLSNFTELGSQSLQKCQSLGENLVFPSVVKVGAGAISNMGSNLKSIDFHVVESIGSSFCDYCSGLTKFIIRKTDAVCQLTSTASVFTNTPIASGTGYIYVPSSLVDSYKAATNWSKYAAQFRALEDYTVDGTVTGALDETKISA